MPNIHESLSHSIQEAYQEGRALCIQGGGSKKGLGRTASGETLSVGGHSGVVEYESTELVITARAGTPIRELETILAEQGQRMPFEPPRLGHSDTLGGVIACGLSGPARPYAGAARDMVLGLGIINGKGDVLRFGGQVMKNVAGYDLSRLMVGAYGTLGVLMDVSMKVLPKPQTERTLAYECDQTEAIERMNRWAGQPLPLSAAAWEDGLLRVRISGTQGGVKDAARKMGGDSADNAYWDLLRDQQLGFFQNLDKKPLWRLSVAPASPVIDVEADVLVDWGGAQRWLRSSANASDLQAAASKAGGHASLFRGGDRATEVFQLPESGLMNIHTGLKKAFDPKGILNPGRLYKGL